MKNFLLLILTLIFVPTLFSQDTIKISFKPKQPVSFFNQGGKLIDGITSPNNMRLDLFDKDTKTKLVIPTNFMGSQSAPPNHNHYLGIATFEGPGSLVNLKDKMEYGASSNQFTEPGFIQCKLPANLGDKEYWITYKVSLADYSKFANSGWGVYFSDKELSNVTNLKTTIKPQLTFTNSVIKNKQDWTELRIKYKSKGNEKYMIIGCFDSNFKTEEVIGAVNFGLTRAYYYVGDIKLIEIPSDIDKDGVIDRKDRCIDVPGLAKYNGCPDTDGDSIPDPDDVCPTQKGLLAFKGCPDSDGDGIEDSKDKCPFEPGTLADNGCKHVEAIVIDENNIQNFVAQLKFDVGADALNAGSLAILDNLATAMKADPFLGIVIGDILDEGADAKKSKPLSEKRFIAIKKYLIEKGCNLQSIKYDGAKTNNGKLNDIRSINVEAGGTKK